MRSFQFLLHRHWDRKDPDALIRWSPEVERDLRWWLDRERLELGVSLVLVSPQFDLWSDASDVGWGAHLDGQVVSGLWSPTEAQESINQRELLAVFYALQHFLQLVRNSSVAVFSDNTTALAYMKNQGGTRSAVLNRTAQDLLRWSELICEAPTSVHYGPQQCLGGFPVAAEPDSGFGMDTEDVCVPATSAAVASSYRSVCNLVKSPLHTLFFSLPLSQFLRDRFASPTVGWVAGVCLSSLCADSSSCQEAPLVLWGVNAIIAPYWPQRPWLPELLEMVVDGPVALPLDKDLLSQPHFHRQHLGLSRLALHAWRLSSNL